MAVENLLGLLGFGAFSLFFLMIMFLGLVEMLGKFYATYHSLIREDLTGEQRIIYLVIIWFVPIGWGLYLLLGKERTSELFKDVKFL